MPKLIRAHADSLMRRLRTDQSDLLRGVRVGKLLQSCGAHLVSSSTSGSDPAADYAMSERVERLHDFVSHDWRTDRWRKHMSLLVHYNSGAAMVASMTAVSLRLLLAAFTESGWWHDEPKFAACMRNFTVGGQDFEVHVGYGADFVASGIVTFWFFFVFWQNIRSWVFRCQPRFAFVDKFCIHQTDDDLKREGILSLAGFLQSSDRLVVLWSSRYFSRLWCSYELATWAYFGRDFSRTVDFVPVQLGMGLVAVAMITSAVAFFSTAVCLIAPDQHPDLVFNLAIVVLAAIATVVANFILKSLHKLPLQLKHFSLQNSQCFCCTNNHTHPETGANLPCDRALIYSTLARWSSDSDEQGCSIDHQGSSCSSHESLAAFNEHMQTCVLDVFTQRKFLPTHFRYHHALMLVMFDAFKFFSFPATMRGASLMLRLRMILSFCCICFCQYPIFFKTAVFIISMATKQGYGGGFTASLLAAFVTILVVYFTSEVLYKGLVWYVLGLPNPTMQIVVTIFEIFATWLCFRDTMPGYKPHRASTAELQKSASQADK